MAWFVRQEQPAPTPGVDQMARLEAFLRASITSDAKDRADYDALAHGGDPLPSLSPSAARTRYIEEVDHAYRKLNLAPSSEEAAKMSEECWPAWDPVNGSVPSEDFISVRDHARKRWQRRFPGFDNWNNTGIRGVMGPPPAVVVPMPLVLDEAGARQRLKAHIDKCNEARAALDLVSRAEQVAAAAAARFDLAKQTIEAIKIAEREDAAQWLSSGIKSDPPPPRSAERAAALLELQDAEAANAAAGASALELRPQYRAACDRLNGLVIELPRLQGAVMRCILPALLRMKDEAYARADLFLGLSQGLTDGLKECGVELVGCHELRPPRDEEALARRRVIKEEARQRVIGWMNALGSDAVAVLSLED